MDEQASPAPPAPRKRAWFQLHLSTCVVLMLAAGVLMWANAIPQVKTWSEPGVEKGRRTHGFPLPIYEVSMTDKGFGKGIFPSNAEWSVTNGVINTLIACALLSLLAYLVERFICRRRKSASSA